MDHPASISAALTTQSAQNPRAKPAIALWVLAAAFTVIAVAVVLADATLTPEQRIAVFVQTGNLP
jgi:type IV secretory pathway component VirB8